MIKQQIQLDHQEQSTINEDQQQQQQQPKHVCTIITPSFDYLNKSQIQTDVLCTVPNCNEIFSNISALNLHLNKVHKIVNSSSSLNGTNLNTNHHLFNTITRTKAQQLIDNCKCKYYCPAINCKYNLKLGGSRYLPTFHSLKIHFIRMHGEKLYSCSKCSRKFSIKSEMCRHEEKCGILFKCSCGCPFSTIETLIKHAQLNSHCIPPYGQLLTNKIEQKKQPIINLIKQQHQPQKFIEIRTHDKHKKKYKLPSTTTTTTTTLNATNTQQTKSSTPNIIIINNICSTATSTANTQNKNQIDSNSQQIQNSNNNNNSIQQQQHESQTSDELDNTSNSATETQTSHTSGGGFTLFKLHNFEIPHQRSLGCQTQLLNDTNRIETSSQTIPHPFISFSNNNSQSSSANGNIDSSTQYTQTSQLTNRFLDYNYDFNYLDASTSPINYSNNDDTNNSFITTSNCQTSSSAFDDYNNQFWAEMSTQTFLSAFDQQQQQQQQQQQAYSIVQSNNNEQININHNFDQQHQHLHHQELQQQQQQQQQHVIEQNQQLFNNYISHNTHHHDQQQQQNPFENREMQTCEVKLNTTYTQTNKDQPLSHTYQTTTTETDDLVNDIDLDLFESLLMNNNNNSCSTSTSTVQTQTSTLPFTIDTLTQTPWEFTFEDVLF